MPAASDRHPLQARRANGRPLFPILAFNRVGSRPQMSSHSNSASTSFPVWPEHSLCFHSDAATANRVEIFVLQSTAPVPYSSTESISETTQSVLIPGSRGEVLAPPDYAIQKKRCSPTGSQPGGPTLLRHPSGSDRVLAEFRGWRRLTPGYLGFEPCGLGFKPPPRSIRAWLARDTPLFPFSWSFGVWSSCLPRPSSCP